VDIFADGRQLTCYPSNLGALSAYLFPPLPDNVGELKQGWTGSSQDFRFECRPAKIDDGFAFDAKVFSPFYGVLADEHASHYVFDTASSFMASSDETITVRGKYSMDGFGGVKLLQSQMLTDAAIKRLTNNADAYFAAMLAYDQQIETAMKAERPASVPLLATAGSNLKSAVDQLTDPLFHASAQERLDHHRDTTQEVMKRTAVLNEHIGKPAFAFATTDLDGHVVRLADQRGKVVVLDFWYRGCGWCARTMPMVNALVMDFANQPVTFYAMSTDNDPADARFVVKQLGVKSVTLRAEKLAEPMSVTGFPTLIVIDKHGNIRSFDDGYRPTLRQDVGKLITDLLREP
jgi:thiol-disulfide isomerase/thioredoxin